MNACIIHFLNDKIKQNGMNYTFVAEKAGIAYQRFLRIFNQNATISGSELICVCRVLGVQQSDLLTLLDNAS